MTTLQPVEPDAYWSWRRRFAFAFIQLSLVSYAMGAGAFVACKIIADLFGGDSREMNIGQAFPIFTLLYLIAGFMILAVVFSVIALIFSRRALYLAILYVPTSVYAYYELTT